MARGPDVLDATLSFAPGLNVVEGVSNTGKTYAWQLIDFMLGSSKPPKHISQSAGYTHGLLELLTRSGDTLTLERALDGGDARAYDVPIDSITEDSSFEVAGGRHDKTDPTTISGRLLSTVGLLGNEIRKDTHGGKVTVSFRDIARLVFVDEERIITEHSPALSAVRDDATKNKSAFWLLVTGADDSAIVTHERPKDRRLRLAAELSVLDNLLDDRTKRLRAQIEDESHLADRRQRIAQQIDTSAQLVVIHQSALDSAVAARDTAWSTLQSLKSKRLFVIEQINRLELLQRHYSADAARLESALEAGRFFELLPSGECPVCGQVAENECEEYSGNDRIQEFAAACESELAKIELLSRDLDAAISTMRHDLQRIDSQQVDLQRTLDSANDAIEGLLSRSVRNASDHLSSLLAEQSRLSEASYTVNEIEDLLARKASIEQLKRAKRPKPAFAQKHGAAVAADFCRYVTDILREWRFPFDGTISWSETEFDLVIGNENRGSQGKGFRAVTHAAFTVALMRYCLANDLPHPGLVMIDSPLNPFKGADKDIPERINTDVHDAFYSSLAADTSGGQIVVFENIPPQKILHHKMRHTHFSGNPTQPRAGLFPIHS